MRVLNGHFELRDELGAGGMGTVYRGVDQRTGEAVAVKQLKSAVSSPEILERFRREGEALRDLNHPNIVRMLDAFEDDGQHYLVMEYVGGGDLNMLLARGRLPLNKILTLSIDLADALTRAHKLNIIHRDLKPANVLIGDDGTLRLTDFGVAHIGSKQRVTGTDAIVGTVDYLPPEAFDGGGFDARGDIWAFGVMLFEMLSGERPFKGSTIVETIYAISSGHVPDLETMRTDAPPALVDLIYRMLERDPAARIRSVRLVGAEIEAIADGLNGAMASPPRRRFEKSAMPTPLPATVLPLAQDLTDRELEVLTLLDEGLSNREIADKLFIELSTVKWYNRQIYNKLGVSGRREAVARGKALGLLDATIIAAPVRPTNNLPAQTTPFVGREAEVQEITRLIEDTDIRLVSIIAQGGMGKTRLALEVAERLSDDFVDGVFFVELAPLAHPDEIVVAIANAVNFPFQRDEREREQQVLDFLSNKEMLLVLDNFEHLMDGAALTTRMLKAAPQLEILVTSRQRLSQTGETVFDLGGMDFPDWETPDDALEYAAVKLFMQSARRVQPQFELRADNMDAIAHICKLVQGMPLGILLAASWLSMLSPEEIAAEIVQGIDFLESEMGDMPERHRSIRAVFEQSWDMLTDDERAVFMKLSIFRGGFTREAAQAVTGAGLRTLMHLLNKSLVQRDPDSGRYSIHELLRQYGEEALTNTDQVGPIRDAHAAYYSAFMAGREADLKGRRQLAALDEIQADFENVRAAWAWTVDHRQYERVNAMADALSLYFDFRGKLYEAYEMFAQARAGLGPQADEEPHRVWHKLSAKYHEGGVNEGHKPRLERALASAHVHNDQAEVARCHLLLGEIEEMNGNSTAALNHYEESLAIYRSLNDTYWISGLLGALGTLHALIGDMQAFDTYSQQSLEVARTNGNIRMEARVLALRGNGAWYQGNYAEAEQIIQEAYAIHTTVGGRHSAHMANDLGDLAFLRGDFETARAYFDVAESIVRDFRGPYANQSFSSRDEFTIIDEQYEEAIRVCESRRAKVSRNSSEFQIWVDRLHALAACGLGDYATARRYMVASLKTALEVWGVESAVSHIFACLPAAPIIEAHEGDPAHAVELLGLIFTHPKSASGWMEKWPLLTRLRDDLCNHLGEDGYNAAWERGKALDLETTVQGLIAELGEETD